MNKIIRILVVCVFTSLGPVFADEMASEASINELLELTHAEKLIESSLGQVDSMMQNAMNQANSSQNLNAKQQEIMDDFRNKYIAMYKEVMTWKNMQTEYMNVHKKSFTQNEIDGMIAFYKSVPGKAVIAKMPLVMQNTMQFMQAKIMSLMPKLQQMQRDTAEKMKAARTPAAG